MKDVDGDNKCMEGLFWACTSGFGGSQNAIAVIWGGKHLVGAERGDVSRDSLVFRTVARREHVENRLGVRWSVRLEVDGMLDLLSTKTRQGQQRVSEPLCQTPCGQGEIGTSVWGVCAQTKDFPSGANFVGSQRCRETSSPTTSMDLACYFGDIACCVNGIYVKQVAARPKGIILAKQLVGEALINLQASRCTIK